MLVREEGMNFFMVNSNFDYEGLDKKKLKGKQSVTQELGEGLREGQSKFLPVYTSEDYENYIVQYTGDILKALEPLNYVRGYASGENYFAAIAVKKGRIQDLLKAVPEIVNIEKSYPFTLSELRVVGTETFDNADFPKKPESLNGEGVIIGIIGTGIDYLNERFMTQDGSSRVIAIWDQTIYKGPTPKTMRYGTDFSKDKIASAVAIKRRGGDPYSIVDHRDEVGHGTALAGIIGGRSLGNEDTFKSIAPRCDFAIVKLKEAKQATLEMNGISERKGHIYESTDIAAAVEYLHKLQISENKAMVVYIPLESNCGGHDGQTTLERYLDIFNMRRGFAITSTTGTEGDKGTHTSGILAQKGDIGKIDVEVDEKDRLFCLSIWLTRPDKVSVNIITPTGEKTGKIEVPKMEEGEIQTKLGDSLIKIQYYIQQESGGEQVIILIANNVKGGIWQVNLIGDIVVNGRYDVWMHQKSLLRGETRFLKPDIYTTLTVPCTGRNVLCTGYYNKKDGILPSGSGRGYTRDGRIKPTVIVNGYNILTTGLNNSAIVTSGVAVAGAVLTGAVALLLEWGIVEKNDANLYSSKIATYLIRGTIKSEGIVHPNPDWGYGILTCEELFKNLGRVGEGVCTKGCFEKFYHIPTENLFFSIPYDAFKRLKV